MIDDILAGPFRIREKREKYLPKYEAEGIAEYNRRLAASPWRPEFEDALRTLSQKPFTKDVAIKGEAPQQLKDLSEDIDGCGNNITRFSHKVFHGGIAKGLHAILVDYPTMNPGATLADERNIGAKPYWVSIRAEDMCALYTAFIGGHETVTHVRIREDQTVQIGFDETVVSRVRVFDRPAIVDVNGGVVGYGAPVWQLWEKSETGEYAMVASGVLSLEEIPLVLFWTGERVGCHFVKPPLLDLADMQLELYRALSRREEILTYGGSPMLQAKGMNKPGDADKILVGPKSVLYAPPSKSGSPTEWDYVQPDYQLLDQARSHIESVQNDMRRVGMQPMVQQSGGVTATATSTESAKAHSTLQAWALQLKDALEQAFVFTSQWLNINAQPEVDVSTDFSAMPFAQAPLTALQAARDAHDIDHMTYLDGLRRFDVLPPDADLDAIAKAALDEGPPEPSPADIAAALGNTKKPPKAA